MAEWSSSFHLHHTRLNHFCSFRPQQHSHLLPDAAALTSKQRLPRSGNSSAQTSASLHPPAALRLRVLPFTRTWSSTVCAEECPTPRENACSLNCCCSDRRKSFGPSAPIAYATYVSPPDEAVAWPCARVLGGKCCCWLSVAQFLQITARTNPCSRHLWGTLVRAVASI